MIVVEFNFCWFFWCFSIDVWGSFSLKIDSDNGDIVICF